MMKVDSHTHGWLTLGLFVLVIGAMLVANELAAGRGWGGVLGTTLVVAFAVGLGTMIVFKGKRRAR